MRFHFTWSGDATIDYGSVLNNINCPHLDGHTHADLLGVALTSVPIGALHRITKVEVVLADEQKVSLINSNVIPRAFLEDADFQKGNGTFAPRWRKWLAENFVDEFAELSALSVTASNLREEVAALKKKAAETEAALQSANDRADAAEKKSGESVASLKSAEAKLTETAGALGASQDQLKSAEDKLIGTAGALEASQDQLGSTVAKLVATERALKDSQDQLKTTKAKLAESGDALMSAQALAKTAATKLAELELMYAISQDQLAELEVAKVVRDAPNQVLTQQDIVAALKRLGGESAEVRRELLKDALRALI